MNMRNKRLLERYAAHPLKKEIEAALTAAETFAGRAAAIGANRDLSDAGREKEVKARVREALRDIRDAAQPVGEMKARLKAIVDAIKPVSFDKTDVIAGLLRQEIRAALRGMSLAERAAILLGEKADATFVDAMLEAPALLSGADSTTYERAREQRLESLFARESFAAEDLSDQIAEVESALTIARQDVRTASGLPDHEFDKIAEDVATKRNAPWLKREGDGRVVVVPVEGGAARSATPDELRDGEYFADLAAYRAARGAA